MYKGKRIIALIPARGGSKGLPKKNIKVLAGKPLIAWSIGQALACRYIDRVVVSTDSPEIASAARRYRAEVPFMRPKILAADKAKSIDVILHALDFYAAKKNIFDIVVLLQPTSPLRNSGDIAKAIEAMFTKKAKAIISVCRELHSPLWSVALSADKKLGSFLGKGAEKQNRQSLPVFYRINGAVYVADTDYLKQNKSFLGNSTYAYEMTPERSIDIDSELDFKIAEFLKNKR